MSTHPIHPWPQAKRIVFRFLFVFFFLKIFLTIDFMALSFGTPMPLIAWGQQIFTPPSLWLNDNVFHFYYNPYKWYTFTHALLWVRFIVYVAVAAVACGIWSLLEKNRNQYEKLDFWWRQLLTVLLSCVMFSYGIIKVFPVQMAVPDLAALDSRVGDLHPFNLFWATMGYGVSYQVFTGAGELFASVLLLFRRTRPVGLLMLFFILINIVVLNYAFSIGVLGLASFLLLMTCYLLAPYVQNLWRFFANEPASVLQRVCQYRLATPWKRWTLIAATVLFVGSSYLLSINKAYIRYTKRFADNRSTTYFTVNTFVCNSDTLGAVPESDTIRWRYWTERITGSETTITVYTTKPGTVKSYTASKDSANHLLVLRSPGSADTTALLTYALLDSTTRVEGSIEGKKVIASLQQITPNAYFKLLKVQPQIIETDPEQY